MRRKSISDTSNRLFMANHRWVNNALLRLMAGAGGPDAPVAIGHLYTLEVGKPDALTSSGFYRGRSAAEPSTQIARCYDYWVGKQDARISIGIAYWEASGATRFGNF